MAKTIKFYTDEEVEILKKDITAGIPIPIIGKRYSVKFGRNAASIIQKSYSIQKLMPKTTIKSVFKPISTSEGISIPKGLVWEGNGEVKLYKDHFRIYFK